MLLWQPAGRGSTPGSLALETDTVVLRLAEGDAALDRLAAAAGELKAGPGDPGSASRYARLALERYALTGDARFLGYAEGALAHWREDESPPESIWLLRGRILQTQHRFADAAAELDRLLAANGPNAEGLLLAADAWRRVGNLDHAKARCAGLAFAGWPTFAKYCVADVLLSLGKAEQAHALLSSGQIGSGDAPPGSPQMAQWMLAIAGDAAAAAGCTPEARTLYETALAVPGAGIALHAAYADLLLGKGLPREALAALAGLPDADAVLLRRAIAAKQLGLAAFGGLRQRLLDRFADARAFGADTLHLREQALFALMVEADADAALTLAAENWAVQKGWEDAELLMQAARAAGRAEAARAIDDWRKPFDKGAT